MALLKKPAVGVAVDGLLVVVDGVGDVALPQHEVADAVEQRDVELVGVLIERSRGA